MYLCSSSSSSSPFLPSSPHSCFPTFLSATCPLFHSHMRFHMPAPHFSLHTAEAEPHSQVWGVRLSNIPMQTAAACRALHISLWKLYIPEAGVSLAGDIKRLRVVRTGPVISQIEKEVREADSRIRKQDIQGGIVHLVCLGFLVFICGGKWLFKGGHVIRNLIYLIFCT